MESKQKKIVVGCILGLLLIVVIWMNLPDSSEPEGGASEATVAGDAAVKELERAASEIAEPKPPPVPANASTEFGGSTLEKKR